MAGYTRCAGGGYKRKSNGGYLDCVNCACPPDCSTIPCLTVDLSGWDPPTFNQDAGPCKSCYYDLDDPVVSLANVAGRCRWDLYLPQRRALCPGSTVFGICLHGQKWNVSVQRIGVGPGLRCSGFYLRINTQPDLGGIFVYYVLGGSTPEAGTATGSPAGRYYYWKNFTAGSGEGLVDSAEFPEYIDVTDTGEVCAPSETTYYRRARLCDDNGFELVGDAVDEWITEADLKELLMTGCLLGDETTGVFKNVVTGKCVRWFLSDLWCNFEQPDNTHPFDPPTSTPGGSVFGPEDYSPQTDCATCNTPPPGCDTLTVNCASGQSADWELCTSAAVGGGSPFLNYATGAGKPRSVGRIMWDVTGCGLDSGDVPQSGNVTDIPFGSLPDGVGGDKGWTDDRAGLRYQLKYDNNNTGTPTTCAFIFSIESLSTGAYIRSRGWPLLFGSTGAPVTLSGTVVTGTMIGMEVEVWDGQVDSEGNPLHDPVGCGFDFDSGDSTAGGADVTLQVDNKCLQPSC